MSDELVATLKALASAEGEILLLSRSHPKNWQALTTSLSARWSRGDRCEPDLAFAPPPDFTRLRASLAQAAARAEGLGPWGQLLADRAWELESEAALAEQIGRPGFRAAAKRQYAQGCSTFEHQADELASSWCCPSADDEVEPPVVSDDFVNPLSLINRLRAEMKSCNVSIPIRVDKALAAVAAVDRECLWIRGGELLTPRQSHRIAVHEIHGHALRRIRAREPENALSSSGFKSSDDAEEGRAIWLESTSGLLNTTRKRELAWRHLAARACQRGASFVDTVEALTGMGCALKLAFNVSLRIWRGGGLARESIYLRAYVEVRDILDNSVATEHWMQRGRYSTSVAARLAKGDLVVVPLDLPRG